MKIKCIGYLDFKTAKVYRTKTALLIAQAKRKLKINNKRVFGLALMRKLLIEAKIAILKLKKYTWQLSCKIASLKNELKAMKIGYSLTCKNFLKIGFSDSKKLFN